MAQCRHRCRYTNNFDFAFINHSRNNVYYVILHFLTLYICNNSHYNISSKTVLFIVYRVRGYVVKVSILYLKLLALPLKATKSTTTNTTTSTTNNVTFKQTKTIKKTSIRRERNDTFNTISVGYVNYNQFISNLSAKTSVAATQTKIISLRYLYLYFFFLSFFLLDIIVLYVTH